MIREVTKNNPLILLAFWPVFFVATRGEYSNMHLWPRLQYEPKFGAILGVFFFCDFPKQCFELFISEGLGLEHGLFKTFIGKKHRKRLNHAFENSDR